jgi:TM2 domain-containing membrane protein YozV
MKAAAIILNVFLPGVGSFFVGKPGQGIVQIVLYFIGIVLSFTVFLAIIGVPLCIGVWIWGVITATSSPSQPIQVNIVHQSGPNLPSHGTPTV